ncbi:amidohydrolase family protein [Sandaracinus amylolyticus]|uniref:amidohydrolase family protein n=1 Tax=Sandaracinus amylolyticus TaxID=927083 RepID=UPI001F1DF472|nr:amidohydrolase family protein [Sandaracinus amylolyticus]UJR83492.1 Hypothetical protein I5071_55600 [Sandaracinus amylolyticus]
MDVRVIDAWIQHPPPTFLAHPMFETLRRWMRLDVVPESIPLELTLGAMDAAGVERALLSAWWGPGGPLISNDDVARWVDASGGRLIGVASADLRRPMEAVREIRRCAARGFRAVRVLPWLWELPPDHPRYYPIYAACVDLGLPFCTQVGHTGPSMPSEPGRPIPYLDRVALDFPELVIVGGHVGHPWTEEMISLATKYPNVYIDTSAYKATRYPASLVAFMRAHGRKKVLFGSNHPMITPGACLEGLDALGLDEEARRLFLRDNAVRIFGL